MIKRPDQICKVVEEQQWVCISELLIDNFDTQDGSTWTQVAQLHIEQVNCLP